MNSKHLILLVLLSLTACYGPRAYSPYAGQDAATLRLHNNSVGTLYVTTYQNGEKCIGTEKLAPILPHQQFLMRIPGNRPVTFGAFLSRQLTWNEYESGGDTYTFLSKTNGVYEYWIELAEPQWRAALVERDSSGRFVGVPYQLRKSAVTPPLLTGGENCQ